MSLKKCKCGQMVDWYIKPEHCNICIILELKQQLKEANEVIEFYGDSENWVPLSENPQLCAKFNMFDHEQLPYEDQQYYIGGKRAREYKKKWG